MSTSTWSSGSRRITRRTPTRLRCALTSSVIHIATTTTVTAGRSSAMHGKVVDVVSGSAVVMGSAVGHCIAKVIACDFEVSDEGPIFVLDLVPLTPQSVEKALAVIRAPQRHRELNQARDNTALPAHPTQVTPGVGRLPTGDSGDLNVFTQAA